MNVQIEKFKTGFYIKCKYNENILSFIQKYEKRYWNKEKIEWSLRIEALQDFTNDIQKLVGIQLEVKDNKPYAIFSKVADKIELKFVQFINQFDEFKAIEQVVYDKKNRKLIVFESKVDVLQRLKENKIDFIYDPRYTDKVDTSKVVTGKFKVSKKVNKAIQADIPISVEVLKVNKVNENTDEAKD